MGFPGADRPGFRCASLEQPAAGSQHTTGAVSRMNVEFFKKLSGQGGFGGLTVFRFAARELPFAREEEGCRAAEPYLSWVEEYERLRPK